MNVLQNIISSEITARQALTMLNVAPEGYKTLFVVNSDRQLIGTVTDGDIRRGLIFGKDIDTSINNFLFKNFKFFQQNNVSLSEINVLRSRGILLIPIIDAGGRIVRIIDLVRKQAYLPIDAIIMAGGRGERLRPMTDDIPKPMLRIGDKPIIEYNVDRIMRFGIDNINISINYLGHQLIEYFGDGSAKGISITYIEEHSPLGTIGAIKFCKQLIHDHLLVMNSDLLTNIDFEDFYKFFLEQEAAMAIATVPYKVDVPYAVLDVHDYEIRSFKEKPVYTFYSNAGIYLFKKEIIDHIPEGALFNATDLIEHLIREKMKVVSYPILEYWLDIGNPDDFKKAEEDIKHLKF